MSIDKRVSEIRSNDTSPWESDDRGHNPPKKIKAYVVTYITTSYEDILIGLFKSKEKAEKFVSRRSDPQNYTILEREYLDDSIM